MEEDSQEDLNTDEAFADKFGRPAPDMVVGLTSDGFINAVSAQLTADGLIPENQYITGMVTNINFGAEGYLPLGLYLEEIPDKLNDETPSRLN